MEHPSRIQQLYGYSACLVALITFLITLSSIVDAVAARRSPLQAAYPYGGSRNLTSFEVYEANNPAHRVVRVSPATDGVPAVQDTLTGDEARARFEVLQAERRQSVMYSAGRELVKNGLLMFASILIFVGHWLWLRRLGNDQVSS